jgi:CxxC motif-containing protein (DUF1111 family)
MIRTRGRLRHVAAAAVCLGVGAMSHIAAWWPGHADQGPPRGRGIPAGCVATPCKYSRYCHPTVHKPHGGGPALVVAPSERGPQRGSRAGVFVRAPRSAIWSLFSESRPLAGGATTVFAEDTTAFGRALANLDASRWREFLSGKARFVRPWPQAGPCADAVACADCHYRDGRGPRPDRTQSGLSHLLRLGRPSPGADSVYGVQLRRTGYGVPAPGRFEVHWEDVRGRYPSGEPYTLRRSVVDVTHLAYGPLDRSTQLSLRVPPAVFGLGLLEAVSEDDVVALADPDDGDRDGISGRAQHVRDPSTGRATLGRFGWKGAQPSLAAQSATALREDIGVTTPLAAAPVRPCEADRDGNEPEVGEHDVAMLVQYLRALAPPARRSGTRPPVLRGERLFSAIGCDGCHRLRLTTGDARGWPELSHQTIAAYTDLLLHDLGPQLADGVGEGVASGSEWRTPPLWGLGLLATVSGASTLMHDGRARSPEEAILWHGGEAERARERFIALPPEERRALIDFLATL